MNFATGSARWMLALAAGMACVCATAGAQPDGAGAPGEPQGQPPIGAGAIRERIEQRREQLRRAQERVDQALKMLDSGATIEQVREAYPEFFRQRPGGPGGPGGGGPEGMDAFDGPPGGWREGGQGGPGGPGGGMRGPGPEGGPDRFERQGGGERGGRERGAGDRVPTDEDRAAIREFLRLAQPRLFEMLEDLEKRDPEEAKRKLTEAYPRLRSLLELRKSDPELFELRMKDLRHGREAMESARWLVEHETSGATDDERTHRREAMKAALLIQFDARTEIQRREMAREERRHAEAKADLERRSGEREQAVAEIMSRMLEREQERLRHGGGPDEPPPPPGQGQGRRPGGRRGDR